MKVQVMSNKILLESGECHGGAGGGPAISIFSFEDVDALKNKIRAVSLAGGEDGADTVTLDGDDCGDSTYIGLKQNADMSESVEGMSGAVHSPLYSADDADAALSISSDTTLEPESVDILRAQEGRLGSLSLSVERRKIGSQKMPQEMAHTGYNTVLPSAIFVDDLAVEVGSSARFSKVLENISLPLLYIPTTKRLVAGNSHHPSCIAFPEESTSVPRDLNLLNIADKSYLCNDSESASSTLDLSSCDLLSPHSPMHKAHSAQEFHCLGRYSDSDRLTVHSTDSCPGFHCHLETGSPLFADNSSLSSVSTGTDFSVSAVSESDFNAESKSLSHNASDEAPFVDINLHSRNSFDKGYNSSSLDSGYGDKQAPVFLAARKKSFTGFKNFFSKKAKEESPPGWKLFGRVPPKPIVHTQSYQTTSEFQARQLKAEKVLPTSKKQGLEVMSTTALILESRPINLPSKKPEETEKHKQQYDEMVEAAKRKEMKDMKLRKKQIQQQRKSEDQLVAAARIWDTEILPNWEVHRSSKRTRELWWQGLPPNVRGRVWQLAVGNDLNITHALYNICHERAEEQISFVHDSQGSEDLVSQPEPSNKEASVRVIKLDVSRTFPHLCIFQKGGPLYDLLHSLLGAYACYRPDVGYVQGMSFIAAILLLNMDVADAFVCFANLLNRPCQLAFFRMDENLMMAYYRTFEEFFKENLPKLYAHFSSQNITPNLYLMEWVFLMYSKSLPLDVACRVWDVFFRDGEEFLFRTAIAILKAHEGVLLKMDFIHAAQFLTKLPEDLSSQQLFKEIEAVKMNIEKRGFHAFFKDLHTGIS